MMLPGSIFRRSSAVRQRNNDANWRGCFEWHGAPNSVSVVKITTPDSPSSARPPVRGWPAAAILALVALAIFYFRVVREDSQQWRNVYTMETCVVGFALLLVWVLFLSRLPWKVRLLLSGSAIGIIGLAAALVRI